MCVIIMKILYRIGQYKKITRCRIMAMNYNKLWKLLIDKNLMKKDLKEMAGISSNAIAKMGKGGDVSTQVLRKICEALNCRIEDIIEIIPDVYEKKDN